MEPTAATQGSLEPERYSYTSLKEKQNARLLQLQPFTGDVNIEAKLVEVSLHDARECGYEALSYAWGPPTFSERIFIDNEYLPVTANLLAALKSLAEDKPRFLWIDAICINQTDLVEKSTQIPLMTEIYRSAKQVIVWLGEETEGAQVAFDWIPECTEEM